MNLNPQFTYDQMGNKTGVFLTLDEFEQLTGTNVDGAIEGWERDLIRQRMAEFRADPNIGVPWDEFRKQWTDEDGTL